MIDVREFVGSVTHQARSLDDLSYPDVRRTLEENSIVRIRGLFDAEAIRSVRRTLAERFDARRDEKHDPRDTDAVRRNFQKLQIGASSGVGTRRTLGRFLRILYNPIFADDIYGMREHFVTLARFRNRLFGLPHDYAIFGTDDGLWTCSRILQYPRGGGFMVPHRDMFSQIATVEAGLEYYQPLLLLSQKGEDYGSGGAYIDRGRDRVSYEGACDAGDVVVYDGRTIHGVADIDPLEPLDLETFCGRAAAFVSLFRHLQPGDEGYRDMAREAGKRYGLGVPDD